MMPQAKTAARDFPAFCLPLLAAAGLPSPAAAQEASDHAKSPANPVAILVSVPFQFDFDPAGPGRHTDRSQLNIQPVTPIGLNADWNVLSLTLIALLSFDGPGFDETGIADMVTSVFLLPMQPTAGGWILGAGPVFLLPTGKDMLSAETCDASLAVVVLCQRGPWTHGGLANQIWPVGGSARTDINATFPPRFLIHTTPAGTSVAHNSKATHDGEADARSVRVDAVVSRVFGIGNRPVSAGRGARNRVESRTGGPRGRGPPPSSRRSTRNRPSPRAQMEVRSSAKPPHAGI
jgi:hypothetical protein